MNIGIQIITMLCINKEAITMTRQETISQLAEKVLEIIETLKASNLDDQVIRDQAVWSIEKA